jgi:multidrug resistance efflux pump
MADQNALNYEQVRVDAYRLRDEVDLAKVNLDHAESVLKRNETLLNEQLVSRDIYEESLRSRDFFAAEVKAKTASMQQIEARLAQLRGVGEPQAPGTNQVTSLIISRLEQRMSVVETNYGPITLRAPISGRVHLITRRENEYVVEGEQLVMIASPRSERIVAYMRQPFSFEPQPGMEVDVMLQNKDRQKFATKITEVGAQMEAITNGLALVQQGALVDMGLPIVLAVPPNVQLRPGEIVGIALRSSTPLNIFGRKQVAAADKAKPLVQLGQ